MIVPNFIPDPIEVPGNVTEQPYLLRLRFIRRVTWLYFVSVAIIGAVSLVPMRERGLSLTLPLLCGVLVALEVWRILTRGKRIEGLVSGLCLPVVLLCVALIERDLRDLGLPTWQALAGPLCIGLYTAACGRDYSFVGNFLLSLIGSSVAVAAIAQSVGLTTAQTIFALSTNVAILGYVVYDLASLLSRRRMGEELAAVTDIYRDVFNFFGYFVRVARHWRRHKIWSMPSAIDLRWKGRA